MQGHRWKRPWRQYGHGLPQWNDHAKPEDAFAFQASLASLSSPWALPHDTILQDYQVCLTHQGRSSHRSVHLHTAWWTACASPTFSSEFLPVASFALLPRILPSSPFLLCQRQAVRTFLGRWFYPLCTGHFRFATSGLFSDHHWSVVLGVLFLLWDKRAQNNSWALNINKDIQCIPIFAVKHHLNG